MLASNDDKNYRNTCMHHIKPTGIALRTRTRTNTNPNDTEANAAGTSVVNWHRSLYDLCTIAVCEGLDPFAVPNKELNRIYSEKIMNSNSAAFDPKPTAPMLVVQSLFRYSNPATASQITH